MKTCPICSKKMPDFLDYCSKECTEKAKEKIKKEAKPVRNSVENQEETRGKNTSLNVEEVLTNPVYQRGAGYRAEKLKAICNARKRGLTEEQIVKLLLRGGLTRQTANVMMQDSREAYS